MTPDVINEITALMDNYRKRLVPNIFEGRRVWKGQIPQGTVLFLENGQALIVKLHTGEMWRPFRTPEETNKAMVEKGWRNKIRNLFGGTSGKFVEQLTGNLLKATGLPVSEGPCYQCLQFQKNLTPDFDICDPRKGVVVVEAFNACARQDWGEGQIKVDHAAKLRSPDVTIGSVDTQSTANDLMQALNEKASKYKSLSYPLVIACAVSGNAHDRLMPGTLYGTAKEFDTIAMLPWNEPRPIKGFWNSEESAEQGADNVIGVMVLRHIHTVDAPEIIKDMPSAKPTVQYYAKPNEAVPRFAEGWTCPHEIGEVVRETWLSHQK
jgi:hypothetical protein